MRRFATIAAGLLCLLSVALSQTVTGTLEGHITDSSGGALPGTIVVAKNIDTGLTRKTVSNEEGYYQLTFLPVGSYTLTAEAKGFGTVQREAAVELSSARTADFQLKPSSVSNEITIVADVTLIDTSTGEVKSTLDEKTIEDRPLPSRNILSLVEQLPGFQSSGGFGGVNNPTLSSGSYVVFGGSGSRSATFQIDGVNNDDSSEGINRQNVNVSTIKEFQVLTNAYSAQHGRAGGAVVLVQTKSGTNVFHGDAYDFLQNDKLNTNSFFNNASGTKPDGLPVAPRTPYRRNQFGYTIGGPIIRNRLFFFHSLERTALIQYSNSRAFLLPFDKVQVGDCRLCVNPADHPNLQADVAFVQSVLDRYPKAKPNATAFCDQCFIRSVRFDFPDQDYSGKLDYNPSSKDSLATRYQYSRAKRRPEALISGSSAFQNHKQQNVALTETHLFSPSTSGEFRFGLGLRTTLVDISTGNDTPIIGISNTSPFPNAAIGSAGQFPIHRYQTDYQYVYNISHVRGKHIIKAGIDYRNQHLDDLADNYSRGWYQFTATGTVGTPTRYEGWENLLRGFVSGGFNKGYGNFLTLNRLGESNQYIMDDYKVRPSLTLNLGFRVEYVKKPKEQDNKIAYNFGNYTGYEPRFGFAWSPSTTSPLWSRITGGPGKFAIRGGAGLYHDRIFQSVFSQGGASLRSLPPYGAFVSYPASFDVADPSKGYEFNPSILSTLGRISPVFVAPDLKMPNVQQYNLTIDRQLPGKISMSVGYNRTRGIGRLQNAITNRARFPFTDPATGILYDKVDPDLGNTSPAPGYISSAQPRTNQRRPDSRYGSIFYINNGAWSYYNALRVEVKTRSSKGLQWALSYAFSKTIDTGSDVTQGNTMAEFDSARSLRGLSDFDQRHRMNLNYSYLLPWFNKGTGFARQVLGGWNISGNNTFASGNPFTVTAGYDVNADGVNNDRPILVDQSLFGTSIDNGRQDPATGAVISTLQLPSSGFYPNRFTTTRGRVFDPGGSGRDSLGRKTFFGSGINSWDMRAQKSFKIAERKDLRLLAEMYNVTNSPRFGFPTRDLTSVNFGRISSTYNPQNFVGASRADDTSRVMQMALRFVF